VKNACGSVIQFSQHFFESDLKKRGCSEDETWIGLRFQDQPEGAGLRLAEIYFRPKPSSGFGVVHQPVSEWNKGLKAISIYLLIAATRYHLNRKTVREDLLVESTLSDEKLSWAKAAFSHVQRKAASDWARKYFGTKGDKSCGLELLCKPSRPKDGKGPVRRLGLWLPGGKDCFRPCAILCYTDDGHSNIVLQKPPDQPLSLAQNIESQVTSWVTRLSEMEEIRFLPNAPAITNKAGTQMAKSQNAFFSTAGETKAIRAQELFGAWKLADRDFREITKVVSDEKNRWIKGDHRILDQFLKGNHAFEPLCDNGFKPHENLSRELHFWTDMHSQLELGLIDKEFIIKNWAHVWSWRAHFFYEFVIEYGETPREKRVDADPPWLSSIPQLVEFFSFPAKEELKLIVRQLRARLKRIGIAADDSPKSDV